MVVLLHNIRSLHNVGSILRTADGAGVEKVYLCGITPSPLNRFGEVLPDIKKVALGAEASVLWDGSARSPLAVMELLEKLKKEGYQIVALEQDKKSVPYDQFRPAKKVALIVGAEVEGLPASILKKCDTIIEIPMHGKKESLNVSVAFGIAVFHFTN